VTIIVSLVSPIINIFPLNRFAWIQTRVARLGYFPMHDERKQCSTNNSSRDVYPLPLRKQLVRSNPCSRLLLEAVHLHVRSTTDAGASKMLRVRDRLRRDAVATEQYNSLKLSAARGELSPSVFEYSRNAFFFAAEGDGVAAEHTTCYNSSGPSSTALDGKVKEQEGGTLG
jgi:hypothetical protein